MHTADTGSGLERGQPWLRVRSGIGAGSLVPEVPGAAQVVAYYDRASRLAGVEEHGHVVGEQFGVLVEEAMACV